MNEEHPARKYYLHNGDEQTGPFLLEDLEEQHVTATTMVWYKGAADWQEAGSIKELLPVINHTLPHPAEEMPPPFRGKNAGKMAATPPPIRAKTPVAPAKRSRFGLLWLIPMAVLAGMIIFAIQQFRTTRAAMQAEPEPLTYAEQVLSIEDQEKAAPRKFLKSAGSFKETVFGGKFKIDGTITNTATVAKFKNVVLEVNFYNDKDKYISAERYTIEEQLPPGSTREFKLKIDPPKGADNCKWKAVNATAY